MRREIVALFAASLVAVFASHVEAQSSLRGRTALPPPPGERPEKAGTRPTVSKTAEEIKAERQPLVEALTASVQKLRELDKQISPATAASSASRPAEAVARKETAQSRRLRQDAEKAVSANRRKLSRFDIETICGPSDDSQDVELYDGTLGPTRDFVRRLQPATGQIQWNSDLAKSRGADFHPGNVESARWCSGTLISDNFFLTAGHCFDVSANGWTTPRKLIQGEMTSLPPHELATLMHVNFNYQTDAKTGELRQEVVYPVTRLLEYRLGDLDYAVIELGRGAAGDLPGKRFGSGRIDGSKAALTGATMLTVIQHPDGEPKKIAAGSKISVTDSTIEYGDVDTLGGSSGAGVIDQKGGLIGVHIVGGCTARGDANGGVALHAILRVSKVLKRGQK